MGVKRVTVRIARVVERSHEQRLADITLGSKTVSTPIASARKEFVWEAPVHFNLPEGEEAPDELRITVRGRLGHSGEPEVVGYGTLKLGEVLASGATGQEVQVPLSRHHKRNMEAEAVITEHTGYAHVVVDVE